MTIERLRAANAPVRREAPPEEPKPQVKPNPVEDEAEPAPRRERNQPEAEPAVVDEEACRNCGSTNSPVAAWFYDLTFARQRGPRRTLSGVSVFERICVDCSEPYAGTSA